ncbi:hypothetical protein MGG_17039 [Pyricularia oryzae 70-15]|uniref:Uncharacterized protein n=1 Tax=Pyricularia oryzae (strain 70-15 / ATCC MYA-4617 / FGSC 8958) TaxID=242507 RepID=G4N5X9_PYRO7|nr:uncharacterized protein MGG_17039 [Pyricularia oryzae 70-15]EHA49755.1 hypothetical protein MGG_17039 [Pyricularia oryzae 70-15]
MQEGVVGIKDTTGAGWEVAFLELVTGDIQIATRSIKDIYLKNRSGLGGYSTEH